jgi:2-C-methyl-D-erythritol 4-phosphate cytidylyltransferase/2-C-methyl-D-erythritol 2,4-cyclodiphosphate synthase
MQTVALIMAAGKGVRAGGPDPKQYRYIAGEMVLRHTLMRFTTHTSIDRVVVVISPQDQRLYALAAEGLPLDPPIFGAATRQASVLNGLEGLIPVMPARVLIHDAARPFVAAATIDAVISGLDQADGVIAGIPVVDTVKITDGQKILRGVARDGLWQAQTPQGFRFQAILAAHRNAVELTLTDDADVAERAGLEVRIVPGHEDNFKITHEADFARAELILRGATMQTRMGLGYDVHRFKPGAAVFLGGVEIPHTKALEGHSDADVGLHSVTDAILGAIAQGDIGQHFPPSDPQWKGAASHIFLAHAGKLVRDGGGHIVNIDVTLICEAPRIGPYRLLMQQRIEQILDLPPGTVSVKATTTEGLGFTGRSEGIAAQAIAAVSMPK